MPQLTVDPEFQNLIPPLSTEEREHLEQNLKAEGCRDALVVWKGLIADGHNRHEICTRLNIPFKTTEIAFKDRGEVIEWIIRNQFGRRNITAAVRAMLALQLEPIIKERAKENLKRSGEEFGKGSPNWADPINPTDTRTEVAKLAGVGHNTIDRVKRIVNDGTPEQVDRVKTGGKGNSVNAVYTEITKPIQPEKKTCTRCGAEKDPSEYYPNRNICKRCVNANATIKDFRGNIMKSDRKAMAISEEAARSIRDTEKVIDYTVDDLVEELESLANHFSLNTKSCLDEHKDLIGTGDGSKKIMTALSNAEAAIQKIKEIYL